MSYLATTYWLRPVSTLFRVHAIMLLSLLPMSPKVALLKEVQKDRLSCKKIKTNARTLEKNSKQPTNNNETNNKGTAPLDGRARVYLFFGDDTLPFQVATSVNKVFKCKSVCQNLPKFCFFVFIKKKLCVSKKSSSSEGFSLQCSIDVQMLSSSSKVEYLWNFCQHTQVLFLIREAEIVQEK